MWWIPPLASKGLLIPLCMFIPSDDVSQKMCLTLTFDLERPRVSHLYLIPHDATWNSAFNCKMRADGPAYFNSVWNSLKKRLPYDSSWQNNNLQAGFGLVRSTCRGSTVWQLLDDNAIGCCFIFISCDDLTLTVLGVWSFIKSCVAAYVLTACVLLPH